MRRQATLRAIAISAIEGSERERFLARNHPGLAFLRMTARAVAILAVLFLVTDALAWDIAWSGEPKRRLLGIGLIGIFSALVNLARARHARPADDLLTRLRSGSH